LKVGGLSTVDLLVLNISAQLLFMKMSSVLSLPLQLVFPEVKW